MQRSLFLRAADPSRFCTVFTSYVLGAAWLTQSQRQLWGYFLIWRCMFMSRLSYIDASFPPPRFSRFLR